MSNLMILELPNAEIVHKQGLYLPNNHQMTLEEVNYVIDVVNNVLR